VYVRGLASTCRSAVGSVPLPFSPGGDGSRRANNLNVEAGPERGEVRDGEIFVGAAGVGCGREVGVGELAQAKRRQDGDDVGVVGKVKVEALVERESLGAAVEGDVDLGARVAERVVLEAGYDFLLVS
jgi:hypothetical protein